MKEIWSIDWSNDLLTGFDVIDNHHQKIVELVNQIYNCCTTLGSTPEELNSLRNELKKNFCEHFDMEEDIFKEHKVSGIKEQEIEHEGYRQMIADAEKEEGSVLVQAILLNQIVIAYFRKHLNKLDRVCIKELKEKLSKGSGTT